MVMDDIGAGLAWLGIITAVCTCVATCFTAWFAHERRMVKLKYADEAKRRAEQTMAEGDHLALLLAQTQLKLEEQKQRNRYRY